MTEPDSPGRTVTLVLCSGAVGVLGALPPFDVPTPYWQAVDDVVAGAHARFSVDVTILRLLRATRPTATDGGPVTYLAEVDRPPRLDLAPWPTDPLAEQPRRLSYARPGGPAADLAWATAALADAGRHSLGRPTQLRTWNLSSIWRLPTDRGFAWLKVVPPFYRHEARLLSLIGPPAVPEVLATDGERMLLADVPGDDQYAATGAPLVEMVWLLAEVQRRWIGRVDDLLASGVPDRRAPATIASASWVLDRHAVELNKNDLRTLEKLVEELPRRFAAIEACGIPDALVHGDFHAGNVRGDAGRFVVLDWGDGAVGSPILDQLTFIARLGVDDRERVLAAWDAVWRDAVPGCDPSRSASLLGPVHALAGAVTYQRFLDEIEPDERPYHARDPLTCLHAAAHAARQDWHVGHR
jgi:Phosphotransferase enzyme family